MKASFKYSLALTGALTAGYLLSRARKAYSYRGRVVVITGGSRGLGLALARRLVDEGARLALLARSEEELERASADLRARGGEVRTFVCDVTDQSAVKAVIERIDDAFGSIDVLINNAGVIVCAPFDNLSESDFEEALGIHFRGPLYTTRAVLPIMRRQGGGRILNISSIGGKIGVPHMSAYSASKYALVGFSHALAAELRRERIYVTVACPGLMRTGSHRAAEFRGRQSKEFAWFTTLCATPPLSTSARHAARKLLEACRSGRAEITFPWHWRVATAGGGLLPGVAVYANTLVNRYLPSPTEARGASRPGREVRGESPPRWYTHSIERAAADLNQS